MLPPVAGLVDWVRGMNGDYEAFLRAKIRLAPSYGHYVADSEINPLLKPHQRATVRWLVGGGRRAGFLAFGLGKTVIQLEAVRLTRQAAGGRALIVLPLGVRQEFVRDAAMLGMSVKFIRRIEEAAAVAGDAGDEAIYLTNYETIRDGKLDPAAFSVASLDEASCLRGFGGTKTFREFMRLFEAVPHRFVATATPAPNEFIELLAYAAYLGIMDVGEAKTRFFKRDSEHADQLTLHPHKEREFWLWVSSWALFVSRPSDLDPSFSDEGYALPPMEIRWHEIPADHAEATPERSGQGRLFKEDAIGVTAAAKEKRDSLPARIAKLMEIRAAAEIEEPGAHRIIWHDLEAERLAIERALPNAVSVYGSQELDQRERAIIDFSEGRFRELAAKPVIAGSGCNFQRHCHRAIYLGIGFKFNDFIQSLHRIQRFLQLHKVIIDLIYTETERPVREALEAKWAGHNELVAQMTGIIREFGLAQAAMASSLSRSMGVARSEASGEGWTAVSNDCVVETRSMPTDSVDLIATSIPFATQYEYTPSYNDFGHTDDNDHFWAQMDFLTPELLRVLKPGRNCAIHVKDRIVPGGMTGLGFQTVYPFSDACIAHFTKHGFAFLGRKTNNTDVVRENNQTYRLGWSEQCKDGTRMGFGLPEYILVFRKPQTDRSSGYADEPVAKSKEAYSKARWQVDASGFGRSSGDRLLSSDELRALSAQQIYRLWKRFSLSEVYDFARHVAIGEALDAIGKLPPTFSLLPTHSTHPDVWTDVAQMRSLNTEQGNRGAEKHLCPLPFDIVDRIIIQRSQPGELVYDPFGGLMTVPYRALLLGRRGIGCELNLRYWAEGVRYLQAAEAKLAIPSLFDLLQVEAEPDEDDVPAELAGEAAE